MGALLLAATVHSGHWLLVLARDPEWSVRHSAYVDAPLRPSGQSGGFLIQALDAHGAVVFEERRMDPLRRRAEFPRRNLPDGDAFAVRIPAEPRAEVLRFARFEGGRWQWLAQVPLLGDGTPIPGVLR
jgi:hypothetical protein